MNIRTFINGLVLLAVFAIAPMAQAQLIRDVENQKAPENLKPEQKAVLDAYSEKVYTMAVQYDDEGNVTLLMVSNHQGYKGDQKEKPGLGDEDAMLLVKLPELKGFGVEKQHITEKGFAVLKNYPDMTHLRFHYLPSGISRDFVDIFKDMKELEILEIKHNFRGVKVAVEKLTGYPKLHRLVLDNDAATPRAMELIQGSPNLKTLRLHRTTIHEVQFIDILKKHQQLEEIWVRPANKKNGMITQAAFAEIAKLPKIERLLLGTSFQPYDWEGGLAPLAEAKTLKQIIVESYNKVEDKTPFEKLKKAIPDLNIR